MDKDRIIARLLERIDSLERTAALGFLVPAVVHEVNNPMSVILIGADTLKHGGMHAEPVVRHLDVLNQQSDRIIRISRQMHDLTRRNLALEPEPLDLRKVIRSFADLEEICGGEARRPAIEPCDEPLPVRVGAEHLLQALRFVARAARTLGGRDALTVTLSREEVRLINIGLAAARSPTKLFAVARLRCGQPTGEVVPFRSVMEDFFAQPRPPHEVELMASWEIIRKLNGKLMVIGNGADGVEFQVMVPIVEDRGEGT